MPLTAGARLGPYEIVSAIGAGGMGEVYRARDARLGRDVAIKVLPERLVGDREHRARFEREARAVAAVSHPNILAIHDFGEQDGLFYAVTELLEGETLRQRIVRERLSWRRSVEIATSVADGLAAAHARGIVHRDIKPENIFLTSDGLVKILDFGLARPPVVGSEDLTATPTESMQTAAGAILGTVGYMSPEQVGGEPADARSDIFSLGCVLYEMVAGKRAFSGASPGQTMAAILRDQPPEISASGVPAPEGLDRLVTRCLEKRPSERFQSARDLAFALKEVSGGSTAVLPARPGEIPSRRRGAGFWVGVSAVALAALVGGFLLLRDRLRPGAHRIESLAVLPLANLSGDPQQEYFADGMTEEMTGNLAKISALRVPSRTSVMRYKGSTKSLREIAKELNVDAVVEGSVQRSGDRVRITAQLIEAQSDRHLWAESYEGDLRDVLSLQNDVAKAIAREIKVRLTPEDQTRLATGKPVNPQAYEAFLRGQYYLGKRTKDGLLKSITEFEQAIKIDPGYARAYAGLSRATVLTASSRYGLVAPEEVFPKAEAAAIKALELDDSLSAGHSALAYVRALWNWNWAAAETEIRKAIALDPNDSYPRAQYGMQLAMRRRFDEGIAQVKRALELEPASILANTNLGWVYYNARRYPEALAQLRRTLELDPNYVVGRWFLGLALAQSGKLDEALAETKKASEASGGEPSALGALGYVYGVAGKRPEALKIAENLKALSGKTYVSPFYLAEIYTGLGDRDAAIEWLGKALDERSSWVVFLGVDPRFDPLKSDPRFAAFIKRLNQPAAPPP